MEYSKFWLNLILAALNLTFIRGQKAFRVFDADQVIIRLPCGQGQLSRIWKVQCDWLSLGKECHLRLSRRLWGGMKNELPWKRLRGRLFLLTNKINWRCIAETDETLEGNYATDFLPSIILSRRNIRFCKVIWLINLCKFNKQTTVAITAILRLLGLILISTSSLKWIVTTSPHLWCYHLICYFYR